MLMLRAYFDPVVLKFMQSFSVMYLTLDQFLFYRSMFDVSFLFLRIFSSRVASEKHYPYEVEIIWPPIEK